MGLILVYVLFATATAISSMYELFIPLMKEIELTHPDDLLVEHKYISLSVMMLMSWVFAPVMFGIIMTPGMTEVFKSKMINSMLGEA